ncbi:MAG: tannase/feruloyl esterase family alpha/beta hydrolase [Vicinamibacterales bacterium]
MTRAIAAATCLGLTLAGSHAPPSTTQPGSASPAGDVCAAAVVQARAPGDTTITAAAWVEATAAAPRHCQVDGHVQTPGNTVRFRVGLPAAWNGKFYFQGVGGLAGAIGNLTTGLARGYASASTDTGHDAADPTWGSNRAKEIDYGHRGTHVTAVAAKALTAGYYGRPAAHAYFNGCSNGGRQALMEVQRYPADFDGVIAGDPATGTPMQAGRAVVSQRLLSSPASHLPPEKIELLSSRTLAACDAKDGLADGLISDPRPCDFDPATLACRGGDGPDCLSAPQLEVVQMIYAGLKTPDGREYAPPFPKGHEGGPTGWRGWITGNDVPARQPDGTLAFAGRGPSGYALMDANFRFLALDDDAPGFSWRTFRFPQDLPRLATMTGILSPLDADLRPFAKAGGKLLVYHGWADPGISALGTLHYVEAVTRIAGGQAAADAFLRTYFVPGMHHCSGGPGVDRFDMLSALEGWVERGVAPARIVASRIDEGEVVRSRPLCPHPQVAAYSGRGSVDDAASFVCRAPR